jgi:hypothetical protein
MPAFWAVTEMENTDIAKTSVDSFLMATCFVCLYVLLAAFIQHFKLKSYIRLLEKNDVIYPLKAFFISNKYTPKIKKSKSFINYSQ